MSSTPRSESSAATVDHMERLREYAEWGGKDSTYQWALDEIERLSDELRRLQEDYVAEIGGGDVE